MPAKPASSPNWSWLARWHAVSSSSSISSISSSRMDVWHCVTAARDRNNKKKLEEEERKKEEGKKQTKWEIGQIKKWMATCVAVVSSLVRLTFDQMCLKGDMLLYIVCIYLDDGCQLNRFVLAARRRNFKSSSVRSCQRHVPPWQNKLRLSSNKNTTTR